VTVNFLRRTLLHGVHGFWDGDRKREGMSNIRERFAGGTIHSISNINSKESSVLV
jgi:hypothetical protein